MSGNREYADESTRNAFYAPQATRHSTSDDDPAMRRGLRRPSSRPRPLHWTRLLAIGAVIGAVVAALLTALLAGGDDLVFGRVLFAAGGGAVVGLLTIAVLARLGAFTTVDDLDV